VALDWPKTRPDARKAVDNTLLNISFRGPVFKRMDRRNLLFRIAAVAGAVDGESLIVFINGSDDRDEAGIVAALQFDQLHSRNEFGDFSVLHRRLQIPARHPRVFARQGLRSRGFAVGDGIHDALMLIDRNVE
jgi:hypothetical protein